MRYMACSLLFGLIMLTACAGTNRDCSTNIACKEDVHDVIVADIQVYENIKIENTENYLGEVRISTRSIIATIGGFSDVSIQFPWVSFLGSQHPNPFASTVINEAFHEFVFSVMPFNIHVFEPGVRRFEIDYEITFVSDKYLSVRFFGFHHGSWGRTNPIDEAMTFDLMSGRRMSIGDIFTFEEMEDIIYVQLLSGIATLSDSWANESEAARYAYLRFFHVHFSDLLSNSTLLLSKNFYLREGAIGLIAPLNPYMRQHMIVEINFG